MISIFVILFIRIDTVMLSKMVDDTAVGLYNAAVVLVQSLSLITSAIMTSIFPLFSKYHESSKEYFKMLYEKTFKYLFILTIPIGIGTSLLANKFILLFYGQQYLNSTIALQILIWWYVIGSLSWLVGTVLNATNRQRLFLIFTGICLAFNIILNLILIPLLSFIGASITTVLTDILLFSTLFYYFPKDLYKPELKVILKPLLAGIVMGSFIEYFKSYNLYLIVLTASIVYLVTLISIGGVDKGDLNLIKKIVKRG